MRFTLAEQQITSCLKHRREFANFINCPELMGYFQHPASNGKCVATCNDNFPAGIAIKSQLQSCFVMSCFTSLFHKYLVQLMITQILMFCISQYCILLNIMSFHTTTFFFSCRKNKMNIKVRIIFMFDHKTWNDQELHGHSYARICFNVKSLVKRCFVN